MMSNKKRKEEILNKIYRNARIALQSTNNVLTECDDAVMRAELKAEYKGYDEKVKKISEYMLGMNLTPKDIGPIKKTFMKSAICLKTLFDNRRNHLSDMMLKGTIMGVIELYTVLSQNKGRLDEDTEALVKELLNFEEDNEKKLKALL